MLLLGEELYLFLQSFAFHVFFITNLRSNHNIFLSYLLQVLDYRNVKWIWIPFFEKDFLIGVENQVKQKVWADWEMWFVNKSNGNEIKNERI